MGYVVEYKDPTTGRWKEANDFPIDECVYQGKTLFNVKIATLINFVMSVFHR